MVGRQFCFPSAKRPWARQTTPGTPASVAFVVHALNATLGNPTLTEINDRHGFAFLQYNDMYLSCHARSNTSNFKAFAMNRVRGAKPWAAAHYFLAAIRRDRVYTSCAIATARFRAKPSRA